MNKMLKKELEPGIIHYIFSPRNERNYFADSIITVIDEGKAILIDVGYEDEAQQVIDDLSVNGITIDKIVISHFHADHLWGVNVLPDIPFYGGVRYKETLIAEGCSEEEIKKYTPTVTIDKPMILKFGRHELELIPIPISGHAVCTIFIKINRQFLQIGDEMMFSVDGQQILPYLCDLCDGKKDIRGQIKVLDKLENYSEFTIIPAHGPVFEGGILQGYIQNLKIYLNAVLESKGKISYEQAVKNCDYLFLHSNWHEHNCQSLR